MIGIKLEGETEFLQLEENTTIQLKLENPIFGSAEQLSPGSYSFPFSIPVANKSPKNSKQLKHSDVVENTEAFQIQKATLFIGNVPFKSGNLKSESLKKDSISANFFFGLNAIDPAFKTAKLRDVISENIVIGGAYTRGFYVTPPTEMSGTFSIELFGQSFDNTGNFKTKIDNYLAENGLAGTIITELFGGFTPILGMPSAIKIYCTEAYPSTPISLKVSEEEAVVWQVEPILENYDLAFQNFFSATNAAHNKIVFPLLYNFGLHADVVKYTSFINAVDEFSTLLFNNVFYGIYKFKDNNWPALWKTRIRNENSIQPFVFVKHIIDKISEQFNIEFEGDFFDWPDYPRALLDSSITLDVPVDFYGPDKFIFWRRSFNINELVPDISVVEFLKSIAGRYNLAVYVNESTGKVRLSFREPIARSIEYDDITDSCSPKEEIADNRITGFRLYVPKEETDVYSIEESITVGEAQEEYPIKVGRIQGMFTSGWRGADVTGPVKYQPNNAKFGLRIMFYNGVINNGEYLYTAAINNGPLADENEELTNETEDNLYTRHHKYWLHYEKNRITVSVIPNFPLRKLLRFDWALKRRYDRTNYLIKSMDIRITTREIQVTGAELYTQR